MLGLANHIGRSAKRTKLMRLLDAQGEKASRISVSRNSSKWTVGPDGNLRKLAPNTMPWDYDPATLKNKGALIEEEEVQYVHCPNHFLDASWENLNNGTGKPVEITPFAGISPDGKARANKLVFDTGAGTTVGDRSYLRTAITPTVTNDDYTATIWLKGEVGGEEIVLRHVAANLFQKFVLTTEWQKFEVTESALASTGRTIQFGVWQGLNGIGTINSSATVYCFGVNVTKGSKASSFIFEEPTFVSRNSPKWYVNSEGVLTQAAVDEEVTDHYRYFNGQWVSAGQLLEDRSTNLCIKSEDFTDNSVWVDAFNRFNRTANQATSPKGNTTADLLECNTTMECRIDDYLSVLGGTTYTFSLSVQYINNPFVSILFYDGSANGVRQWFNIQNGTLGTTTAFGSGYSVKRADINLDGNGFYKIEATIAIPADTTAQFGFAVIDGNGTAASIPGRRAYVWGGQIEVAEFATSNIFTNGAVASRERDVYTTSTTTRSADDLSINGTNFSDFYNQNEGAFVIEYTPKIVNTGGLRLLSVTDGTENNHIVYSVNSTGGQQGVMIKAAGALSVQTTHVIPVVGTTYKAGFTYSSSRAFSVVNGSDTEEDVTVTLPTNLNQIVIAQNILTKFEGHISSILYSPKLLSDAKIQAKSTL